MKLTVTFEEMDFLVASLGFLVDDDDVDEDTHAVASALLDRFIVATDAAKGMPLDQPSFPPTSFNTVAELEVAVDAAARFARWEAAWNKQYRTKEDADRGAAFSAMVNRLRAALDEVLNTRTIDITVLPDRGQ